MKKNILIVDNDQESAELHKKILEAEGLDLDILIVDSMKKALEKLDELNFDIIITEIMLEHIDSGFSLCHSIKEKNPDIPVIILSDIARKTGIHFGIDIKEERDWIKADEFIDKHVSLSYFVSMVEKHLK
ncbi:MAG: response regulator [bacterium]